MTDAEILTLVRKLEQCEFAPSEFHHRDHLAVSVAYLYAADTPAALGKMRASLKNFIAHHGLNAYHETITRFWMERVAERLDRRKCLSQSVREIQEQLGDKELVYQYFSKEVLSSSQAKQNWVEPDREVPL